MSARFGARLAIAATAAAIVLTGHAVAAEIEFFSRDTDLLALVPAEALEGPGSWVSDGRIVATGQSIALDALGTGKARRTEREFAEEDAKARIARAAARAEDREFDEETHALTAEVSGFQTAATYKLAGRDTLLLVGLAKREAVRVRAVFDPKRAGVSARAAFDSGDFSHAARLFAMLTQHGVQDAETAAIARAAAAHVNLAAGVTGGALSEARQALADFYFRRGEDEEALRFCYALYRDDAEPDRALVERLVELSRRTHREKNAAAFQKEITRRWPAPTAP